MSQGLLRRRYVVLGLICTLACLGAGAAMAVEWDDAVVTKQAEVLHAAVQALLADPGAAEEQTTAMQQRKHDAALRELHNVERLTGMLVDALREGAGRNGTEPMLANLRDLVGRARVLAEDSWLTMAARARASEARLAFAKLASYYQAP